MTSLISFLMFMLLLLLTTRSAQSPIYMYNSCQNTTGKSLTTSYQTNRNNLFAWIRSDSATSKGYNHTTINNGGENDAVYGVYDCRRDITGYLCQFCLNTAVSEMVQQCPNGVSAVVWYDVCIVRYSNHSFYNDLSLSPIWIEKGSENIKDSSEAVKAEDAMQGLIRKATVESNQSWAISEFNWGGNEKRYGLVQCARELTSDQCRQCLEALLEKVPECCGRKVAFMVIAPSCGIKFDDHTFSSQFSNQTTSPSPLPNPAKQEGTSNSKTKTLIITIVSVLVAAGLLSYCVYSSRRRNGLSKDGLQLDTIPIVQGEDSMNTDLPTIPLIVIQQTTNNFSESSKLGEGGFGSVYKGTLPDGTEIAVKRLSEKSGQGSEEFKNEVIFIAKLQHRNLVRLLGCCIEGNEKLLVYEFMSNSSLDFHLFNEAKQKQLDWKLRLGIINGIARGLLYLHEDSRLRVIHRDLKASNVLLDHDMNPKISDFGLARTFEKGQSQTKTKRVVGTYGYMAPEYAMAGLFSVKSDVFSFGVLLLEIICGKRNGDFHLSEYGQSLLVYAWRLWCEGKSLELINPLQENTCIESEVMKCIHIGLLCVQEDAADRPIMSTVAVMLGSDTMALPKPKQPAFSVGRMSNEEESSSKNSKDNSVNEVTVTTMAPR